MNENKQQSTELNSKDAFSIMVNGAEKMVKPWKWALILTNLFWAIVLSLLVLLAYSSPVAVDQTQNFPQQVQEQSIKGVK